METGPQGAALSRRRPLLALALLVAGAVAWVIVARSGDDAPRPAPGAANPDVTRSGDGAGTGATESAGRDGTGTAPSPADDAPVTGTVVDVRDAAVADAQVAGVLLDRGRSVETRTRDDGTFALPPIGRAGLRVVVQHPGFLPANVALDAARGGPLRVTVHRRPVVRGRVLDERGRPLPRYCVALQPLDDGVVHPIAEPPPGARWLQDPAGRYSLTADAAGSHALLVFGDRCSPFHTTLDLPPDAVVERDVTVTPGVVARGHVRDAGGVAVAGAVVEVLPRPRSAERPGTQGATDADGLFELPPLPPGDYDVVVSAPELPTLQRDGLSLSPTGAAPFLDLQLPVGAAATGAVQPWHPGRRADVVFVHEAGQVRRAAVDGDAGTFALRDLTPGRHRVFVERGDAGWRGRVANQLRGEYGATIELRPGTEGHVDVADPVEVMARLRGRVTGHPDPGRLVVRAFPEDRVLPDSYVGMFRAGPQADGSFVLDGLLPGSWRLQVMFGTDVLDWEVVTLGPGDDLEHVVQVEGR